MERVKAYFEKLAEQHIAIQHSESQPHFCYLNDEKEMLLPAQMGYPFLMFGHGGFSITDDEMHQRWQMMLSVQTHVTDTGDDRQKTRASGRCLRILNDILVRCLNREERLEEKWLRGIDLANAVVSPIENESDALYGWVVEFQLELPWCRKVNDVWEDKANVPSFGYGK
jgi:hypothetical protein